MKIAVCFKIIADFSLFSQQDWNISSEYKIETHFARHMFNCLEESALEMALRLAEQVRIHGHSSELTALTLDGEKADLFLRHLHSVQYDNAVRIHCDEKMDMDFNPSSVSFAIAAYIKNIKKHHIVFLGAHGGEGDNCQTGMLLAERLGWPCIRNVIDVKSVGSIHNCLKVTSQNSGCIVVQKVTLPLVLVTGNAAEAPYLRVPTLNQKLKARNKQISVFFLSDLGLEREAIMNNDKQRTGLRRHKSSRQCIFINGSNAREKAQYLYDCYLKNRLMP